MHCRLLPEYLPLHPEADPLPEYLHLHPEADPLPEYLPLHPEADALPEYLPLHPGPDPLLHWPVSEYLPQHLRLSNCSNSK